MHDTIENRVGVRGMAAGTCAITASREGDANYHASAAERTGIGHGSGARFHSRK